jgi:sugar phosphate isomerase/epimerase
LPAGDSAEQRQAEIDILAELARQVGSPLAPRRFAVESGVIATVDGASEHPPLLVEVWAHHGPPKPAQKAKVIADAFKLLWLDRTFFNGEARKILALSDEAAARHFQATTWVAVALRDLHIEVIVVPLPEAVRAKILVAQQRQPRPFDKSL